MNMEGEMTIRRSSWEDWKRKKNRKIKIVKNLNLNLNLKLKKQIVYV